MTRYLSASFAIAVIGMTAWSPVSAQNCINCVNKKCQWSDQGFTLCATLTNDRGCIVSGVSCSGAPAYFEDKKSGIRLTNIKKCKLPMGNHDKRDAKA